jgi:hypothetical protein
LPNTIAAGRAGLPPKHPATSSEKSEAEEPLLSRIVDGIRGLYKHATMTARSRQKGEP